MANLVQGGPQRHPGQRDHRGRDRRRCAHAAGAYTYGGVPVAFYVVVSVCVIGLYLAFLIPIYLRVRMGSRFMPGPWTVGPRYKVLGCIAVTEIVVISVYFILPIVPAGVPFSSGFTWSAVNYAFLAVGGAILLVGVWWVISARHWFTGPIRTIDQPAPAQALAADGSRRGKTATARPRTKAAAVARESG